MNDIDLESSFIGAFRFNAAEHFDDGSFSKKKGTPKRICMKFRLTNNNHTNNSNDNNNNNPFYWINLMAKTITQKNFSNRKNLGFYKRGSFAVTSIIKGLKCVIFPINDSSKLLRDSIDFSSFSTMAKLVRPRMIAINDTIDYNEKHPPIMITSGKDQSGGSSMVAFFIDRSIWGDNSTIEADTVSIESNVLAIDLQLFQSNQSQLSIANTFQSIYQDLPVTLPLLHPASFIPSSPIVSRKKRSMPIEEEEDDRPTKRTRSMNEEQQLDYESNDDNDSVISDVSVSVYEESMSESEDDLISIPASPLSTIDELVMDEQSQSTVSVADKSVLFDNNSIQNYSKLPYECPHYSSSSIDEVINTPFTPSLSFSMQYLSDFSSLNSLLFEDSLQIEKDNEDHSITIHHCNHQPSLSPDDESMNDEWQPPYLDNEAEIAIMKNYRPPSSLVRDESFDAAQLSDNDFDSSTPSTVGRISYDSSEEDSIFA